MKFEDALKEELATLSKQVESEINDPAQKAAFIRMTADLALIPIRAARGEDVTFVTNSLKAEAAMRSMAFTLKAQALAQQAWINVVFKVLNVALTAAV